MCLGGGYGGVPDRLPLPQDPVAVALGGDPTAGAERVSGEGCTAAGAGVAGAGAVVGLGHGEDGVEAGVAGLVPAGGAAVAVAGADGAGVPVEAGAQRPVEVQGAQGLADHGEGRAETAVGLAYGGEVGAAPDLVVLLLQLGPRGRGSRRCVVPAAPLPRCARPGPWAWRDTTAAPAAEPGTGIETAALRLPEITAPTVVRSGSGSGRVVTSRSSGTGHPASRSPVIMRPRSRSVFPVSSSSGWPR